MQNSSSFKQYGMPIIVLVVICIVISGALAATYSVANPIIIENTQKAADAARQELLPDADAFTQYTGELFASEDGKVAVTDAYTANNGCGIVFTVETKSFGGVLVEMIGVDETGAITGVKVQSHSDTPGVGTNAQTAEHLGIYAGKTAADITSTSAKQQNMHVTGASVTSNAVHYGIYAALQQYDMMGGVQ